MGQFFGSIFCWFEEFFGLNLADYLWGVYSSNGENLFIGLGFWMFGISLLMVLTFYYIIDKPKLNNWWGWLIFLCINAGFNFIVGWQSVLSDKLEGLMTQQSSITGQEIPLDISDAQIAKFGVSDMLLSIIVFILFSFIFKWWSTNCSDAPLKS